MRDYKFQPTDWQPRKRRRINRAAASLALGLVAFGVVGYLIYSSLSDQTPEPPAITPADQAKQTDSIELPLPQRQKSNEAPRSTP